MSRARDKKKDKYWANSLLFFAVGLFFLFVSYIGYSTTNVDLNSVSKYSGIVEQKGLTKHTSGGSRPQISTVFYIKLQGMDEVLALYRKEQQYPDLLSSISVGDYVQVYYKPGNSEDKINIDLIQLEKGDKVILDKSEYDEKQKSVMYIGLLAGLIMLAASGYYFRKYRRIGVVTDTK